MSHGEVVAMATKGKNSQSAVTGSAGSLFLLPAGAEICLFVELIRIFILALNKQTDKHYSAV